MADIRLDQTLDGGDVTLVAGDVALDATLNTAVYLSLLGANTADDGTTATIRQQWWAGLFQRRVFRGGFQAAVQASALTSGALVRLEQLAANDLAWLVADGLVASIAVECSIVGVDRLRVDVRLEQDQHVIALGYEVTRDS